MQYKSMQANMIIFFFSLALYEFKKKLASISGGWSDPCNHDCGHATGKLDFYQVFPIYSTINVQAAVAVVGSSVTRQARRIYVSVDSQIPWYDYL